MKETIIRSFAEDGRFTIIRSVERQAAANAILLADNNQQLQLLAAVPEGEEVDPTDADDFLEDEIGAESDEEADEEEGDEAEEEEEEEYPLMLRLNNVRIRD